ncbi:PLP-dependent aminotransferase family protein [Pseudarthrobacter sp. NPDC057230]|uniref:aminotransferase-like domain-containing protein n=1 Tax=Pseudarthrobacter sp. NPDC057230 TaxID=3346057 RepID=UPI00363C01BF
MSTPPNAEPQTLTPPSLTAHHPVPVSRRMLQVRSSPVREMLAVTQRPGMISLAGGLPAAEFFDIEGLTLAADEVLPDPSAWQYSVSEGLPTLRDTIAGRYSRAGLSTRMDQVLVTTGSQQALNLLAMALFNPGDVVLVQNPTYLAALQVFEMAGAMAVPLPLDDEDGRALSACFERHRPRAVYVIPTFQNPTGRTMTASARQILARMCDRHSVLLIEDDPYSELRFEGAAVPPVVSFADPELTALLGTVSKTVSPGLRVGWVRTASGLAGALATAKQAADLHTSTLSQLIADSYLRSGRLEGVLSRVRPQYRLRRDAMLTALRQVLPAPARVTVPQGGMFIWVELPSAINTQELLGRALAHGVAFAPGEAFHIGGAGTNTLRLSFATNPEEVIREGIRRLGLALSGGVP